jgi:hypothetical protein
MLRNYPQSNIAQKLSAKLSPRYRGPFKIIRFIILVPVLLQNPNDHSHFRADVSQLKAAYLYSISISCHWNFVYIIVNVNFYVLLCLLGFCTRDIYMLLLANQSLRLALLFLGTVPYLR